MSKLFAFNVSKPIEMAAPDELGTYDADSQVWVGHERSIAHYCTKRCGYSGWMSCRAYYSSCGMSDWGNTGNYYACIYIKCDN